MIWVKIGQPPEGGPCWDDFCVAPRLQCPDIAPSSRLELVPTWTSKLVINSLTDPYANAL